MSNRLTHNPAASVVLRPSEKDMAWLLLDSKNGEVLVDMTRVVFATKISVSNTHNSSNEGARLFFDSATKVEGRDFAALDVNVSPTRLQKLLQEQSSASKIGGEAQDGLPRPGKKWL